MPGEQKIEYDKSSIARWMDRGQEKKWKGISGRFAPGAEKEATPPPQSTHQAPGKAAPTAWPTKGVKENGLIENDRTFKILPHSIESPEPSGAERPEESFIPSEPPPTQKNIKSGSYEDISYKILYPSMNSMLEVTMEEGARFKAESGAMVAMSENINLRGSIDGGIGKAVLRKMFSKEKFFFQLFTAKGGSGKVLLSPNLLGDIGIIELDGSKEYSVQKDGFLAGTKGIEVTTKVQNISRGMFSGEGFFIVKVYGKGLLFINAFGAIHELELKEGEKLTVDNKHLVAWAKNIKYTINPSSGPISTFTSGEILVCEFKGPGKLFIQSRNPQGHFEWLNQNMATNKQTKSAK